MNVILSALFIGLGDVLCFHEVYRKYFYMTKLQTWAEARQFCRQHYSDLATFTGLEEVTRLLRPMAAQAWIGLFDDAASWKKGMRNESNSWRWSVTEAPSPGGYQNWGLYQPDNHDGQSVCVKMEQGLWGDRPCHYKYYFVCFKDSKSGPKQYFSVSIALSWPDARSYCRQHHTDLALIEDRAENSVVASFYRIGPFWIGLYREAWRWSDGTSSRFHHWISGQPNNNGENQLCVREQSDLTWDDWPCHERHYFICHKSLEKKRVHRLMVQLQTAADLSHPASSTQTVTQIEATLVHSGLSDVKVQWVMSPRKQDTTEAAPGDSCGRS